MHEKHRPKTMSEVVGHDAMIKQLEGMFSRPTFTNGAFVFQGPSGCGKTTLAQAIANRFCDKRDIMTLKGADVCIESVRDLEYSFCLSSWGKSGWKAAIVDEAHAMSPKAVQGWLTLLEPLRERRIVIFTTTEPIAKDLFGNFTGPFASRCHVFQMEPDENALAARAMRIALEEKLVESHQNDIEMYVELMRKCKNNLREAIQALESGQYRAKKRSYEAPKSTKKSMSNGWNRLTEAMKQRLLMLIKTGETSGKPSTWTKLAEMGLVTASGERWIPTKKGCEISKKPD